MKRTIGLLISAACLISAAEAPKKKVTNGHIAPAKKVTTPATGDGHLAPARRVTAGPENADHLAPAKRAVAAPAVPTDARKIDDNTYAWTDAEGKQWQFRRTPFGWAKIDVNADTTETRTGALTPMNASQSISEDDLKGVAIVDNGETVTFVRQTPFGKLYDTRKKAELTAEERSLVERAKGSTQSEQARN